MGCFSFICKECGQAILSNSFRGQKVKLFLLKEGEIIQEIEGEYDSYGQVFSKDLKSNVHWKNPFPEEKLIEEKPENRKYEIWSKVCRLMFDENKNNGIAAIHSKCFTGKLPVSRSDDDPNQGWGENAELIENYDHKMEIL